MVMQLHQTITCKLLEGKRKIDDLALNEQCNEMNSISRHNLRILGLINSDAGMFQCVGSNPAGSVQAAARLHINEPGMTMFASNLKFFIRFFISFLI